MQIQKRSAQIEKKLNREDGGISTERSRRPTKVWRATQKETPVMTEIHYGRRSAESAVDKRTDRYHHVQEIQNFGQNAGNHRSLSVKPWPVSPKSSAILHPDHGTGLGGEAELSSGVGRSVSTPKYYGIKRNGTAPPKNIAHKPNGTTT